MMGKQYCPGQEGIKFKLTIAYDGTQYEGW